MKHPRRITAALVVLTVLGLGSAAIGLAQSPAAPVAPVTGTPPTATPPTATPNQDTAVATMLADCVKKEQARAAGTTRSEATRTCKQKLTTEPVRSPRPGESPNPTRQEDFSSEKPATEVK
jgi:hypothetical protein